MSGKFTPAACTSIKTSPRAGAGAGISSTRMLSGGPNSRTTTARIGRSACAAAEFLKAVHRERCHALHRTPGYRHFADIEITATVRPDAVRRNEIARQDRVLTADLAHDVRVGVADRHARDRGMPLRRIDHRLVVCGHRALEALHHVV